MKVKDNGAFYTVSVSYAEVEAFKDHWPCSGLPNSRVSFQFNKRNGDLVDITPYRVSQKFDGSAALALAEDAQKYGKKRLGLE